MKTARRDMYENVGCFKGYGISREIRRARMLRKVKSYVLEGIIWAAVMAVGMLATSGVLLVVEQIFIVMEVA